jgi:hypothetical protein
MSGNLQLRSSPKRNTVGADPREAGITNSDAREQSGATRAGNDQERLVLLAEIMNLVDFGRGFRK